MAGWHRAGRCCGRHTVPEVTVDVDGVVVELEPRRLKVAMDERCKRLLPSDAGSSPKDT